MSFRCSHAKNRKHYQEIRKLQKLRYRKRTGSGIYHQQRWSEEEVQLVIKHDIPDRELAIKLHRSVASIQQKRHNIVTGLQAM